MGWKGESRRHSLSRKGIKTNIDKTKRLSVRNFVARGQVIHGYDIDNIYTHFVTAMLWSTKDEDYKEETHLEHNYSIHDVDKETERAIKFLIEDFIYENHEIIDQTEMSEEMLGHDLFLDTQGHGVGFWDRGYGYEGELLSKEARKFFNDSMYAYAGDDGKIYFEGIELKKSSNIQGRKGG
ncbi:hypothetical protein KAU43_07770 [candidate division WOR-3 bacterium]|nr:hypothetical protein [candidate division WOR-3 bacterium]